MSDGLNLRIAFDPLAYFTPDQWGLYHPNPKAIDMSGLQRVLKKELNADIGIHRKATRTAIRTELMADNPAGNTQVVAAGLEMFGPSPAPTSAPSKTEYRSGMPDPLSPEVLGEMQKREVLLYKYVQELRELHASLEPADKTSREYVAWIFEGQQMNTGLGYDNNEFLDVTRSALEGIIDGADGARNFEVDERTALVIIDSCDQLFNDLRAAGLSEGSLEPYGATLMRGLQDNDGMYPMPVFAHGFDAFDQDMAKALLIETQGVVNLSRKVNTSVQGLHGEGNRTYSVIDAVADVLDTKPVTQEMATAIISILERIQRTGVKDGKPDQSYLSEFDFTQKDGKARSVNPLNLIPAVLEGMLFSAFNDAVKRVKLDHYPSLQDPDTRRSMTWAFIERVCTHPSNLTVFDADLSGYDKHFIMTILATIIQRVVKPFFKAKWHPLVDLATYISVYKVFMLKTQYCRECGELFEEAKSKSEQYWEAGGFSFFLMWWSLTSGMKYTHVGGSNYGDVVLHNATLREINQMIEHVLRSLHPTINALPLDLGGLQAGDDFLGYIQRELFNKDLTVDECYKYILPIWEKYNQKMNVKKLWHDFAGFVHKPVVFLQDLYHFDTDIRGMGSCFRGAANAFITERFPKVGRFGQMASVLSKNAAGYDSCFIEEATTFVLNHDRWLAYTLKTQRQNTLAWLAEREGMTLDDLAHAVGVDEYHWGTTKDEFKQGKLRVLDTYIKVADKVESSIEDVPPEFRSFYSTDSKLLEAQQDMANAIANENDE